MNVRGKSFQHSMHSQAVIYLSFKPTIDKTENFVDIYIRINKRDLRIEPHLLHDIC